MAKKTRVGLLFGGASPEHKVSIESARMIFYSLKTDQNREKFDVFPFYISESGYFSQFHQMRYALASVPPGLLVPRHFVPSALFEMDVLFPALHGKFGEDGTIQGFLSTLQIPYVGSGVLASALSMDKVGMKSLLFYAGFPLPKFKAFLRGERLEWDRILEGVSFPLFVKPSNSGSSIGINKVKNLTEMQAAFKEAFLYMDRLILEESVEGCRELECGILGDREAKVSGVGEVKYTGEFYDYKTKYGLGPEKSELLIPADIPKHIENQVQRMSLEIFRLFHARDMARIDFFYDQQKAQVFVNEINTIPGFTKTSMYPKLWEKRGIAGSELTERLIALALNRDTIE